MRHTTIGGHRYTFDSLPTLLAHATPARSGDRLAGIAAPSEEARVAAQIALADLPLTTFLNEPVVPYQNRTRSPASSSTRTTRTPSRRSPTSPSVVSAIGCFPTTPPPNP